MDSKIEKMLDEVSLVLDTDTYNAMVKDAMNLDTKSWITKYDSTAKANPNLAVAWNEAGFDKYSKDKYERYQDAFGTSDSKNPFNQSENWLKAVWQKDFEDIPYETFKSDIVNMSKFWEDEKRAREYQAGKMRREKEVKNWPFYKDLLASEYSKQRYINEPEKSIFSDEGEWYNKGEDVRDVSLGVLGLAGDFTPGAGAILGPSVRTARDIANKLSDSPYQKDWTQIAKDAGLDYGLNLGAWKLANAKKADRIVGEMTDDEVKNSMNVAKEKANIKEAANDIAHKLTYKPAFMSDIELKNYIENLPDSEIKKELLPYVANILDKPVNRKAISDIATKYKLEVSPNFRKFAQKEISKDSFRHKPVREGSPYLQRSVTTKTFEELPTSKQLQYLAKGLASNINTGEIGQVAMQVGKRAGMDPDVNTKEELAKDWYKQNYARDWLLEKPFKPKEDEKDLKWQAYVELRKENGLEP